MNLELKHLAAYLSHKLKCRVKDGNSDFVGSLVVLSCPKYARIDNEQSTTYALFKHIIPFLRPFSHLTKEIEHEGKKIIPAVEIAKLALCNGYKGNNESTFIQPYIDKNGNIRVIEDTAKGRIIIKQDYQIFCFDTHDYEITSFKQTETRDLLLSLHFDIYGLIPAGLAKEVE